MTSHDGATWSLREDERFFRDVHRAGGLWVAVGESLIMTSNDGIQWTIRDWGYALHAC